MINVTSSVNKHLRSFLRSFPFIYVASFTVNIVLTIVIAQSQTANAAGFDNAMMRHSRMIISHLATSTDSILVIVNPATTATEASLGISFAAGYTVNGTPANITVSTASLPATVMGLSITAAPGIGAAATASSGQNVTFALTDLNIANTYGFYITGGITTPATTGQKINRVSTHTDGTPDFTSYTDAIDNTKVAVYIVDSAPTPDEDQIVVTARVSPTYTFALANNTITLDTALATIEYPGGANNGAVPGATVTINTNANNGHAIWLKSGTASGLTSATVGTSIAFSGTAADATPTTLSAGTEGVVIDVDETTDTPGTMTIAAEFLGASTSAGGTPSTSFQEIATASGPVASNGHVVTILPRVAIAATTQSADDYTQTFTVIGAGNF